MRAGRLNVLDWLIVAAATHATIAIAALLGADRRAMSIVLAALALAMVGVLFMLWRRAHERAELRYLVEALALLLAVGGCLGVVSDPAPNWPYLLALTTGVVVTAAWRSSSLRRSGCCLLVSFSRSTTMRCSMRSSTR